MCSKYLVMRCLGPFLRRTFWPFLPKDFLSKFPDFFFRAFSCISIFIFLFFSKYWNAKLSKIFCPLLNFHTLEMSPVFPAFPAFLVKKRRKIWKKKLLDKNGPNRPPSPKNVLGTSNWWCWGKASLPAVGRSAMRWSCLQFNALLLPESYRRLPAETRRKPLSFPLLHGQGASLKTILPGMWYEIKQKQQKMPKARANITVYSSTRFSGSSLILSCLTVSFSCGIVCSRVNERLRVKIEDVRISQTENQK